MEADMSLTSEELALLNEKAYQARRDIIDITAWSGGDPEMVNWTGKQPERIYQITVDDDIAAYLRVKAGKTKAGRGTYTRRRPFIHLKFNGIDGAMPVILNEVDMLSAVKSGYLTMEGSPEHGRDFGDFMMKIQDLIT